MRFSTAPVTVAALLAGLALSGCGLLAAPPTDARTNEPIDLEAAEVKEYEGKRLDSVADFRENSIKGPQEVALESYKLAVKGKVDTPLDPDLRRGHRPPVLQEGRHAQLRRGLERRHPVGGSSLRDLLEQAGYDPNAKMVIFRCYDGYSTSLPLDTVVDRDILLAYKMNGIDLPAERGFPFQVVAEDKWGYKWAKWVTEIEVSERRGLQGLLGEPRLRQRRNRSGTREGVDPGELARNDHEQEHGEEVAHAAGEHEDVPHRVHVLDLLHHVEDRPHACRRVRLRPAATPRRDPGWLAAGPSTTRPSSPCPDRPRPTASGADTPRTPRPRCR